MSLNRSLCLDLIGCLLLTYFGGTASAEAELNLIRDLMENYDPDVRPSQNVHEAVKVSMDLTVHQIIDLDAKNQIMTCAIWQRLYWKDDHLRWNVSEYDDLPKIRLSADRIWKPDVALVNDIRSESREVLLLYSATVSNTGEVSWLAPRLLESSCTLDMTYFPWDNQVCVLQFTSWSHDLSELNLVMVNEEADNTDYIENGEWELIGLPVLRKLLDAPCCEHPFPNLYFEVHIQRRARYYIGNLIFPSALITTAGMLVFCLPPESGEKVSLSVTILLATTVYQLLLADRMPVQSMTTPLIGRYIMSQQILLALSTALTVFVLNIHNQGVFGHRVPRAIRMITNVVAKLLCLSGTANKVWRKKVKSEKEKKVGNQNHKDDVIISSNTHENCHLVMENHSKHFGDTQEEAQSSGIRQELQKIQGLLTTFEESMEDTSSDENRHLEWMLVAKVLDRLFLVSFGICIVVVSLVMLIGHPNYRSE